MPQFYVPTFPEQASAAHGLMPHTGSRVRHPHCDTEKQAQGWLNGHNPQLAYYGIENTDKPLTFGPGGQSRVEWPRIEAIYRVEVQDPERLAYMEDHQRTYFGLGTFKQLSLDPSAVLSRTTTIYPDALHDKPWIATDEPHLGEHLKDEHIAEQLMQRGTDLQRLYHILERSGPKEREDLNLEDRDHREVMQKLCVYRSKGELSGNLEDRAMTMVLREIGEQVGVRTALEISAGRIEAEFAAQLASTSPEAPAEERVAVAMEGTLRKFAANVPSRDAGFMHSLAEKVGGVIHDMAKELNVQERQSAERQDEFVSDLPDELRPAWAKVPEEDKDEFIAEFERQRKERAELDAKADAAVFAATTFAMQRAANIAGKIAIAERYDAVLEDLNGPVTLEDVPEEPDEIGDDEIGDDDI